MPHWVLCEDCHRVLLVEHGPVCPECLSKRNPAGAEAVTEASIAQEGASSHTPKAKVAAKTVDESEVAPGCCP